MSDFPIPGHTTYLEAVLRAEVGDGGVHVKAQSEADLEGEK